MARIFAVVLLALGLVACGQLIEERKTPRLLVAYIDADGDVVIRAEPGRGEWIATSDGEAIALSWSPDGERLLVVDRLDDSRQLRVIETREFSEIARIRMTPNRGGDVRWRSDSAAFALSGGGAVDAYARSGRPLWSVPVSGAGLGWSPDGQWFAVLSTGGSSRDVTVVDGTDRHSFDLAESLDGVVVAPSRYAWLSDWSIVVGDLFGGEERAWRVRPDDNGVELTPADGIATAIDRYRQKRALDDAANAARDALAGEVAVIDPSAGLGGLHFVSVVFEDADGFTAVFATRRGPVLEEDRIRIEMNDVRRLIAAVAPR